VSSDGRGEVLLYPYYTTRSDSAGNAYATLMAVVNTTPLAKAARVRFLEGKNSRQVVEFNLFLSPFDVWTAAVLPDTASGGAKIGTVDLTCTLPSFSTSPVAPFYPFNNFEYSGAVADGAGTSLDRTREGHFEIIEMATYASSSTTGKAVTHVNGVPPCGTNLSTAQASTDAQAPSGGLFGTATLLNVNSGTEYTFDAVALGNFYQSGSNYQPAQVSALPDLTQATPPVSSIHAPDGRLYESAWSAGTADAVSAVLMHDGLMNEYVLDTATKSQTDWVMTMPTKRYYTEAGSGNATKLFQRNFNGTAGSCDDLQLGALDPLPYIYDREERTQLMPPIIIGPAPVTKQPLCWGATVLTFNGNGVSSTVFGSTNSANFFTPFLFQNGWLNVEMRTGIVGAHPAVHTLPNIAATSISGRGQPTTSGNTVTYIGLPVIGFAATSYTNGTLVVGSQNVLSNYGGTFAHKTSTTIQ
jgi:hypothetical protein